MRSLLPVLTFLCCAALCACGDVSEQEVVTVEQEIARAGAWKIPAAVRTAGESQYVRYDGAPPYNGGANCSGSFSAGARVLGDFLVQNFGGAKYYQGYNCRTIAGSSSMSIHGTGRAIDVFIPLHGGQADNDLGDPVGNWLIENAKDIGVQYIIWDRWKWSGSASGRKDGYYSGVHPHHDHLHIELNRDGASRSTRWFTSGGPQRGVDPWDVNFRTRVLGLRSDRLTDGPSEGFNDEFVGDTPRAVILLKNRSERILEEVRVGFEVDDPFVSATDYTIYTDRPSLDGKTFAVAGMNRDSSNPAHKPFTGAVTFHLGTMKVGETKKVVVPLSVDKYSIGRKRHVFVRGWLKRAKGVYTGAVDYSDRPTTNEFGEIQRETQAFDVISRDQWDFDATDSEQLEGWKPCRTGHHERIAITDKALRLVVSGRHNCVEAPPWTSIASGTYDEMVIRMRSFAGPHKTAVFWGKAGEDWSRDRRVAFEDPAGDGAFHTYVIPIGLAETWTGRVRRLRIDPLEGAAPADGERPQYDITYVYFQNSVTGETSSQYRGPAQGEPVALLNIAADDEPPTEPPVEDVEDDVGAGDENPDENSFVPDDAAQDEGTEVDGGSDPEAHVHDEEEVEEGETMEIGGTGGCSTTDRGAGILSPLLLAAAGLFVRRRRR